MVVNLKRRMQQKQRPLPASGTMTCQVELCDNKALWYVPSLDINNSILCGVHSKSKKDRVELRKETQVKGKKIGCVQVTDMWMWDSKSIPPSPGSVNVFPNERHGVRTDGLGIPSFSSALMGPIKHGQPDLPDAWCLDNFYEGSKCYPDEVDENGDPTALFYANRLDFYSDPKAKKKEHAYPSHPLYFVWVGKGGEEYRLNYVQSRQFYCTFYERMVKNDYMFKRLVEILDSGTNIIIRGYNGRSIRGCDIEKEYLDPNLPFTHEFVLFSMLVLRHTPYLYPWRVHGRFLSSD